MVKLLEGSNSVLFYFLCLINGDKILKGYIDCTIWSKILGVSVDPILKELLSEGKQKEATEI